ncbi:hypothetical protein [Rossellomorea sp. NPDC077527]|uniref:hypothetical protein n=1 Tax=Rossellomorea sp. NPDC077527 TaxID=3364510 RepID=UPI0037C87E4F
MKWENKPQISEYHPFKTEYEELCMMSRDELLKAIKIHIDDYFEIKSKRKNQEVSQMSDFIMEKWHENSIETFYWKFINKETKVTEE